MSLSKTLLYLTTLFMFTALNAQQHDMELRAGVQFEKDLFNDLSAEVEFETRINDNVSNFKGAILNIELNYNISKKVNKYFRPLAGYRLSIPQNSNLNHRAYGGFGLRYRAKPITFSNKNKYLYDWRSAESRDRQSFRTTFMIKFDKKKLDWKPFINTELIYRISNKGSKVQEIRGGVGLTYEINKDHAIKVFYELQQELNVANRLRNQVIGLTYGIDL